MLEVSVNDTLCRNIFTHSLYAWNQAANTSYDQRNFNTRL